MKTINYLFLLSISLLLALSIQAQPRTIDGLVYNVRENEPVADHLVYFFTPSVTDTLVTKTNNEGLFSMDIQIESPDSFFVSIMTADPCTGSMHYAAIYPFTSSNYVEFMVCSDSSGESNCQAKFEYYAGSWGDSVFTSNGNIDTSSTVYFYDLSIGNIASWFWDFGDGTSSIELNPIHSYTKTGEYLVTLTISGPDCASSIQNWVWVGYTEPGCMAWFYYDFGYNYDPTGATTDSTENNQLTVYFHEYSTGNPTHWKWDFGDGFSSEEQNPVHTYAAPGEYYVYLYISGENCENWYSMPIWVGNYEPPCQAMFGYDYYNWNDSVTTNTDSITVDSYSIYFYDYSYGNPTQWKWDFGDGETSTEQNPWHNFSQEGDYLVSLEIANDSCNSSYSMYVYVGNFVDDSIWTPQNCQSLFYPMNTGNNKVEFINQSYGNIDSYYWEFGDGTSSNEVNPFHQYSNQGEYLVTLAISSFDSCYSKFEMFVWVGDYNSDSVLTALFLPEINGNTVIFHDKSTGIIDNRYWDFGDGSNSTSKDPIHIYEELKTYYVTLGISNTNAVRTFTMEINLLDGTFKGYFGSEDGSGVVSIQNISSVHVYPNPVSDKFTIDFNSSLNSEGKISLFNLSGQRVIEKLITCKKGFNTLDLDVNLLEKGIYMLQITCGNQLLQTKKIVK